MVSNHSDPVMLISWYEVEHRGKTVLIGYALYKPEKIALCPQLS
jgi:hypothetical protein